MTGRCGQPWKQQLTRAEAADRAAALNRRVPNTVQPYGCPAGGHWHVGNPRAANRRGRTSRGRANRRTAWQ